MRSKKYIEDMRKLNESKLQNSMSYFTINNSLQQLLNEHIKYMQKNNISELTFTYKRSMTISILFDGCIEFIITKVGMETERIYALIDNKLELIWERD